MTDFYFKNFQTTKLVRIEGVGHHFEQYHRQYYIAVVVLALVVVAENANSSEKKLT